MIVLKLDAINSVDTKGIVDELVKRISCTSTDVGLLNEALTFARQLQKTPDDLEQQVIQSLNKADHLQLLRNWVFQEKPKVTFQLRYDWAVNLVSASVGQTYLERAQANWERKMLQSLNSMCQEMGITLAGKRDAKQSEAMLRHWNELSTFFSKQSSIKPVFGPKDMLDVLVSIKHPCVKYPPRTVTDESEHRVLPLWGIIRLPLSTKDLQTLRIFYEAMSLSNPQSGIDDYYSPLFESAREQEATNVLKSNSSAAAQQFLRRGCPLGYRAKIWALYLNVKVIEADQLYYNQLKHRVAEDECMTDLLICKEVQLTASNDDMHFVFCDYTYQVLLPFSRDSKVLEHFRSVPATPSRVVCKNNSLSLIFPPSGVIPFHGFSMYVLPLCYLYDDPVTLYVIFRELYCRFFHKLHSISDDPSGIICLCLLFERLLQAKEPDIFYHLRSIGIQPLRFVFKWIMRAFSGFLTPDQVLLLWDRILAYDSLEILPILAVAIFMYRKVNLLLVNTCSAVEAVLADLTTIRVISLLQLVLFTNG